MLYTRKGDGGTTKAFNTKQGVRISKSSCQTEALGAMDEINSFLGLAKRRSFDLGYEISGKKFGDIVHDIQQTLFIVQAELAGAEKTVPEEKVKAVEALIDAVEAELPPIKTFFIPGATELGALFDVARTVSRRAERRVVEAVEKGEVTIGVHTASYINRLSSILYALARLSNHRAGAGEVAPTYS
jgi:cob(I)alamin adenosyltransferase